MSVGGEAMLYSPAEIFVHVLMHERQHHGDLNTLLYQLGVEVPVVEFRFSLQDRACSSPQISTLSSGMPLRSAGAISSTTRSKLANVGD